MLSEPVEKRRHETAYAAVHAQAPLEALEEVVPGLVREVLEWALGRGALAGWPFTRYVTAREGGPVDLEVGVHVHPRTVGDARVHCGTLPAGRYLTAVHTGPYDRLAVTAREFVARAEAAGWVFDVERTPGTEEWACWAEEYVTDPTEQLDPELWRTVLALKLRD